MDKSIKNKRVKKHPSYGYATPDEIERLKEIGIGPERDRILAVIEKRTRRKGREK